MSKKISIFDYLNYRDFLKGTLQDMKEHDPSFTYRKIALELGFKSIGHITWILQGKRNLTTKMCDRFVSLLQLNKKESEYFKLIVLYTNANKHLEKKILFEKILLHRKADKKVVSKEQYRYWDSWYHSALRELVSLYSISDTTKKAGRLLIPHISPAEVQNSLKLLESLGFIAKDKDGCYQRVDKVLSTGDDWESLAIRQYQIEYLKLAIQGIDTIPKEERDISSVLFSVSEERFEQIRILAKEFRQKVITLASTDPNPQRIYQIGIQVFPLCKSSKKNNPSRKDHDD
jgi:uncharacterized protein (TIGR02147 family)